MRQLTESHPDTEHRVVRSEGALSIDERLEALTARHEALTQSVELLTIDMRELRSIHRDNERLFSEMMLAMSRSNTAHAHNGDTMRRASN